MLDLNAYEKWFGARLAELRGKKGVSARDMSLSLNASESYINRIETGKMMPSMAGFFNICSYLGVEPSEFFESDPANRYDEKTRDLAKSLLTLPPELRGNLLALIDALPPGEE